MSSHDFSISISLDDESRLVDTVAQACFVLGGMEGVNINRTDTALGLGIRRDSLIVSIVISFTTSLMASAAYDIMKEKMSQVESKQGVHVEIIKIDTASGENRHSDVEVNVKTRDKGQKLPNKTPQVKKHHNTK